MNKIETNLTILKIILKILMGNISFKKIDVSDMTENSTKLRCAGLLATKLRYTSKNHKGSLVLLVPAHF